MERRAKRLAEYAQERLEDGLRAVGYHTADDFGVLYVREDLTSQYPPDRVQRFIQTSRNIEADLWNFDDRMGGPEASLHVLEEGLIVQFHFGNESVVFLSMDKGVGRDFTQFIRDCRDRMD